jgi:hypothetical protein
MKLLKCMVILQICLLPFAAGFEPVMATIASMSVIDAIGLVGTVVSIGELISSLVQKEEMPIDYTNQLKNISSRVN